MTYCQRDALIIVAAALAAVAKRYAG